ncbi:MAG TPA: DUF1501 domain-containing protein [Usitatibacteraceae bacterium]
MDRRHFLRLGLAAAGAPMFGTINGVSWAAPAPDAATVEAGAYRNLLILVELKGANDGLNTVIPYNNPLYAQLRPRLAIARDQVLPLSENEALHPALKPLMVLWQDQQMAVVQGVGYPRPNLSHFRSIEIWDTASKSEEYLEAGWLARAFAAMPTPRHFAADGVVVGSNDMGPLSGPNVRTIALADTRQFLQQARLAQVHADGRNSALRHILSVEGEIVHAASKLNGNYAFRTEFPKNGFGNQVRTAAQLAASNAGMAVIRLTLSGFDTHANQLGTQANLLRDFADGAGALKSALLELNRWDSTTVMTYAEFGRRPRENQSGGTDHGTVNAHFLMGGKVRGGLYGQAPQLDRLDGNGNLAYAVDFRNLYATVIDRWWGGNSTAVLGGRFDALDLLKA